jgi:putative SOS response-associated peptidase YedK
VCGRYVSTGSLADLSVLLGANPFADDEDVLEAPTQRAFNLAPTDPVPAVLPGPEAQSREIALLGWGLVPPWAEPATAAQRINARIETVLDKPSYRRAVRSRRCLLPADGWYEWVRRPSGARQPYFLRPADGSMLTFAGLYERAHPGNGDLVRTCTILTGPAPEPLAWLHERAPLVVPPELWSDWLDPEADVERLLAALQVAGPVPMAVHPVSTAVNDVRNVGPELIEPIEAPPAPAPGRAAQELLW